VIITSSYPSFAVEAFDFTAVDFLLKPYGTSRFDKAVDRYLKQRKLVLPVHEDSTAPEPPPAPCHDCVRRIQGKGYLWIIPHADILYISADGRRTEIHCKDSDKVANLCLADILALLPATGFCRIHRQFAINRRCIAGLRMDFAGQQTLCLLDADATELPIGRVYQEALAAWLD
jgi:DNA-binding LytR/AlgR family response regulator